MTLVRSCWTRNVTTIAVGPHAALDTQWTAGRYVVGWFPISDAFVVMGVGRRTKGFVWRGTFYVPEKRGPCAAVGELRWVGAVERGVFLRERPGDGWWQGIAHAFVDNLPQVLALPAEERRGAALLVTFRTHAQLWDLMASLYPEMRALEVPPGSVLLVRRLLTQDAWIRYRVFFELLGEMRAILLRSWGLAEPEAATLGCVLNRARRTRMRRITNLREVAVQLSVAVPQLAWSYAEEQTGYYVAAKVLVGARVFLTPHGAAGVFCLFLRTGAVFATVVFDPPIQWSQLAAARGLLLVHCHRTHYAHRANHPAVLSAEMMQRYVAAVACAVRSGDAVKCGGVFIRGPRGAC